MTKKRFWRVLYLEIIYNAYTENNSAGYCLWIHLSTRLPLKLYFEPSFNFIRPWNNNRIKGNLSCVVSTGWMKCGFCSDLQNCSVIQRHMAWRPFLNMLLINVRFNNGVRRMNTNSCNLYLCRQPWIHFDGWIINQCQRDKHINIIIIIKCTDTIHHSGGFFHYHPGERLYY